MLIDNNQKVGYTVFVTIFMVVFGGDNHEDFIKQVDGLMVVLYIILRDNAVVSSQTILNLNKGKSVLPATAGKIAAALGVDVTEIIEEED